MMDMTDRWADKQKKKKKNYRVPIAPATPLAPRLHNTAEICHEQYNIESLHILRIM